MDLYLGQWPRPRMHCMEGEGGGVLDRSSVRGGGGANTSSPVHLAYKWVENRRPGEQRPHRGGGGRVNFTRRGSRLMAELRTSLFGYRSHTEICFAVLIDLLVLIIYFVKKMTWFFFLVMGYFDSEATRHSAFFWCSLTFKDILITRSLRLSVLKVTDSLF